MYAADELRIKTDNDMDEKQRMISLLNYCFDNNIEPWNNQENTKTVESFIISTGGLANSSNDIHDVISTICPKCLNTGVIRDEDEGDETSCSCRY